MDRPAGLIMQTLHRHHREMSNSFFQSQLRHNGSSLGSSPQKDSPMHVAWREGVEKSASCPLVMSHLGPFWAPLFGSSFFFFFFVFFLLRPETTRPHPVLRLFLGSGIVFCVSCQTDATMLSCLEDPSLMQVKVPCLELMHVKMSF